MPEGPELLHSRDVLASQLVGCTISPMIFMGRYADVPPTGYTEFAGRLANDTFIIDAVKVKGKLMWWMLVPTMEPNGHICYMLCTYGMSGQWTFKQPDKHVACIVHLKCPDPRLNLPESRTISFRDPRHFGTLKFVHAFDLTKKLQTLGPDMLSDPPSREDFIKLLQKRPKLTLAQALMNQGVVSGVGNYIKAEALYRARLSPHRTLGSLNDIEMSVLYREVTAVMSEAYRAKGATIRSYRTPEGTSGSAQFRFQVYGRAQDDKGNVVVKEETLDKRTTHWVPAIQV